MTYSVRNNEFFLVSCGFYNEWIAHSPKFRELCDKHRECRTCPLRKLKCHRAYGDKFVEIKSGKTLHLDQEESIDKQS